MVAGLREERCSPDPVRGAEASVDASGTDDSADDADFSGASEDEAGVS